MHCHKDDLLVLVRPSLNAMKNTYKAHVKCRTTVLSQPAGIYHRFKLDESAHAKVMRLFKGVPVWTPYNRSAETDAFPERQSYVTKFLQN